MSTETEPGQSLTYSRSGVDIERANRAKERIKRLARDTFSSAVVGDIGSFAGLIRPDFTGVEKPLLAAGADGVGTKLKIAFMTGVHNTIGLDLVGHITNDLLAQRAKPLFFLDYIASGRLEVTVIEQVVEGLAKGCGESGCVLLGGETAEMPDFYAAGEYDVAGFMVGLADEAVLNGVGPVQEGDVLLGLPSSGLHTNGFSLVRKLFFDRLQLTVDSYVAEFGRTLGQELLTPHRSYLPVLKDLIGADGVRALAHITGGGITQNLDRALPESLDAVVEKKSWDVPAVFEFIRGRGRIDDDEMYRTLNMGVGMILIVSQDRLRAIEEHLHARDEPFFRMGRIEPGEGRVRYA